MIYENETAITYNASLHTKIGGGTPLFSNAWYPLHADLCGLDLSIRTTTYTTPAVPNAANDEPTGGTTSSKKRLPHGDASGT